MDRRRLPAVDQLLTDLGEWDLPRSVVVGVVREALDQARNTNQDLDPKELAESRLTDIVLSRIGPVINATGVLLHTNLGRAPLAPEAAEAARSMSTGYANLELDLATGARGRRGGFVVDLLAGLCGAEAAVVVNNNAAALVLAVAALAAGREVIVSRGELIEIGGSYRLPTIIAAGGAQLREVGTTNRTRISDYSDVLAETTGVILKVHASNYRIEGFASDVSPLELAALARESGVPFVFDAGSGLLDDQVPWLGGPPPSWIGTEPGIRQSVRAGADLVLFSGDKLFGGPQAGVVVGRKDLINSLLRHPLARAFRIDGPSLAALGATAELYADGRGAEIPLWVMASQTYLDLERRCEAVVGRAGLQARIEESSSVLGGGSIPGAGIPSPAISIDKRVDQAFLALLRNQPPILARREAGRLLLDLRAVDEREDAAVAAALSVACR
ncbi:MAG: L-seryl-tRNA(Sec) selenium transferase [Acidimicrobiia bacterium]